MRHMPIQMQIRKLQEYLVSRGHDPQSFDLDQHIDRSLSYPENRQNIEGILNIRHACTGRKQLDSEYCDHLTHQCEIRCDNNACLLYRRIGCQKEYGKVVGCVHERVCPIPVRAFCVRPYEREYRGEKIRVSGYCREQSMRKCI